MYIPITGFATAFCGLLLVLLSVRISLLRIRLKVALGDGDNPELRRAIRAHGNTAEQAPIFLLMSACYEIQVGASGFLTSLVAVFLLGRLMLVWGLHRAVISSARRNGALLTYLPQLLLALMLMVQVIGSLLA